MINFNIINNYITSDTSYVVADNSEYKCTFQFDGDWDDKDIITFVFANEDRSCSEIVSEKGQEITIPYINDTPYIYVGCFAGDRRTTNYATLRVLTSISQMTDGTVRPDPPPTVYDQLIERIQNYENATAERIDTFETAIAERIDGLEAGGLAITPISIEEIEDIVTNG